MLRRLRELNPALIRRLAHRRFFAVNKIAMVSWKGPPGGGRGEGESGLPNIALRAACLSASLPLSSQVALQACPRSLHSPWTTLCPLCRRRAARGWGRRRRAPMWRSWCRTSWGCPDFTSTQTRCGGQA